MEYNIEQSKIQDNFIYIKGWAHFNQYKIKLVINKTNEIIITPNENRYDICMNFHEKVEDNCYGFNIEQVVDTKVKTVFLYIITNDSEILVFNESVSKIHKVYKKVRKIGSKIIRGLHFLWREYHFLVPPIMIKKYIKDLFNPYKNEIAIYDPTITNDYNTWYQLQKEEKKQVENITFSYVLSKKDITVKNNNIKLYSLKEISNISSEYICYIASSVLFDENFNYYVQDMINKTNADLIYCDNDYINDKGNYYHPNFKPSFSYDTLMGVNYIGNVFVIRKSLFEKIGCENPYEILLNCTQHAKKIEHVAKILYHEEKTNSDDNILILKKYLKEQKIDAKVQKNTDNETSTLIYKLKKEPKISIIIPTKDHADILNTCLKSIYEKTNYKNYEIIVIDNNSSEKATFELFEKYKNKSNFKVERLECKFNYSYINNYAIKNFSSGEYILLLNNDTEVITADWLTFMVGYASQKHVGTVGAKLLFPDETIQHAGIVMGKGGLAGHINYNKPRNYISYRWDLKIPYDYAGCTAACLMFSRKKYDEVNGLEENLEVAFNDVDFNLKLLSKGYYNVFLPNVELYHYESKSRGLDTTPEKQKRFVKEWSYMKNKWDDIIKSDPFYNDNYSKNEDYMLK